MKIEMEDEAEYASVVEELRNQKRREGVWARAIVEADGDLSKAQARYIRYRVEMLKEERRMRQEESLRASQRVEEWGMRGWIAVAKIVASLSLLIVLLYVLYRQFFPK